MNLAEIVMLIVGAVLFTVSFFIPDRGKGTVSLDEEEEKKIIRELLEREVDRYKDELEETAEECVNDNRDKMERAMDRITNEKMNAVNEYSDTVIEQIKKNHDEAMFLYDMLNNKHSQVKNTAAELNQLSRSVKIKSEQDKREQAKAGNDDAVSENAADAKPVSFGYVTPKKNSGNKGFGYTDINEKPVNTEKTFEEFKPETVVEAAISGDSFKTHEAELDTASKTTEKPEKPVEKKNDKAKEEKPAEKLKEAKKPVSDGGVDLMFASDNNSANNNDRILALHKEGKSNMAIAKELGLGIGEVKLVIDLFEGI